MSKLKVGEKEPGVREPGTHKEQLWLEKGLEILLEVQIIFCKLQFFGLFPGKGISGKIPSNFSRQNFYL